MYITQQQSGFSLVEVLVAISILLLAIVGPMTIAAKGIQSASYIREQTTALFLAQEGIEAFAAARNNAAIEAIDAGDLSTSWDWVDALDDDCFTDDSSGGDVGCGIEYDNSDPLDTIADCTVIENCRLYFDINNVRARYSLDSDDTITPYKRVIKLTTPSSKELQIESTVYWNTRMFGGQEQSITLTASLFSIYE